MKMRSNSKRMLAGVLALGLSLGCASSPPADDSSEPPATKGSDDGQQCLQVEVVPQAAEAAIIPVASIVREPIHKEFQRHRPRFNCCFERYSERSNSSYPAYSMVVRVTIKPTGLVDAASVEGLSEMRQRYDFDDDFVECTQTVAREMTFPTFPSHSVVNRESDTYESDTYEPGTTLPPESHRGVPGAERDLPTVNSIRVAYPISFPPRKS